MEGREEEWQMILYLKSISQLSLAVPPVSLFMLHYAFVTGMLFSDPLQ